MKAGEVLIDRYVLIERIGRGAQGETWVARDCERGGEPGGERDRDVVVKIVDLEADYRSPGEKDPQKLGRALAFSVNELAGHNYHLLRKKPSLKRDLEGTAVDMIHKNISNPDERKQVLIFFRKNIHLGVG